MLWNKLSKKQKYQRWAWAISFQQLLILPFLVYAAFDDPSFLIKYWEVWLFFFIIPFAASLFIFYRSTKLVESSAEEDRPQAM